MGDLVLSVLNVLVRPFMLLVAVIVGVQMRVTALGLALLLLVVNALILSLADVMMDSITIAHFGWALLAAAIISAVSTLLSGSARPPSRPT